MSLACRRPVCPPHGDEELTAGARAVVAKSPGTRASPIDPESFTGTGSDLTALRLAPDGTAAFIVPDA